MSAESVARWNAIPMTRPEQEPPGASMLKRSSSVQGDSTDDSEDNISLVSRTPSPPPADAASIDKYDEYLHRAPREIITVETKIKSTNKGFAMLAKLGWSEGQPLGLSGDGRVDPIPFQIKNDLTGLGKINQDVRMIETTVSQRRELDSERQRKETRDQRKAREDTVAKRAALKSEIIDTLRPFYCTICEKQFQNVAQYDEHTNSYAHHHKARLRDMQANARPLNSEELEKRKEKERKREEKELRKLARAQGIKMTKPVTAGPAPLGPETDTASAGETKSGGFRKAGWAAVATTSGPADAEAKRSGWAAVGPAPPLSTCPTPPPPPDHATLVTPSVARSGPASGAPMFRTGGWTSLDSSGYPPSPPPPAVPPPPPPSNAPPPPIPTSHEPHDRMHIPSMDALFPAGQGRVATPDFNRTSPPLPSPSLRAPLPPPVAPVRSGWQQWKQGNNSKRR